METKVTLFELLVSCGGVIFGIVAAWIHMRISVATLKTQIHYLNKEVNEEKEGNKEILKKVDSIFSMLSGIKESIASIKGSTGN